MTDYRNVLERDLARVGPAPFGFDDFARRRDRKRRNKRIAAGVVGIAVFVAAVWIVTSVGSLDRSETSVVPGGVVTGPAVTGPAETGPPSARAPYPPGPWCSDGARSRLELTDMGDRTRVRFEVYRSPMGHEWRIRLRHHKPTIPFPPPWPNSRVFFQGTRVASDSGVLAVQVFFPDRTGGEGYAAYAVDKQTGQVCRATTWF